MESGRSGMGIRKHRISGHTPNNPANLREVAQERNEATDARAALRDRRRHEGMADSVRAALSGEEQPGQGKKKRERKRSRRGR